MNLKKFLIPCIASLALAFAPATAAADDRKVKVYRDLDGDGHYNKKTYKVPDYHRHNHPGHYGNYGYRSSYYGNSRYYGYPRYHTYPRSTFGLSIFSRPSYYTSSKVYRSSSSASLAAEVQTALRRRGHYHGPIDGDIGSGSRAAIRAYQRNHGLSVTGRIDSALLRSLRVG